MLSLHGKQAVWEWTEYAQKLFDTDLCICPVLAFILQ